MRGSDQFAPISVPNFLEVRVPLRARPQGEGGRGAAVEALIDARSSFLAK